MKIDENDATDEQPPVFIPDHKLVRCIGRGSYGTVWLARNTMGMYRAVKIVFLSTFQDRRPFDRELSGIRKFEPISRSHEGFIDVLHVGINEAEDYFYYVMELGDDEKFGATINSDNYSPKTLRREMVRRQGHTFEDCLHLGLGLSLALGELHKHGLVHRDVKPSNILFVNGVPKLADIGLVAEVGQATTYVGTEGFIPPEGPGRPQADVYGLGKVLYELSTGKDRNDFPELPTMLDDFQDREKLLELNEVILRACDNDPAKRYASAWDMHAQLLVLANGESVKRLRFLERRLAALKRAATVLLAIVIVASTTGYLVYREWKNAVESRQREAALDIANGTQAMKSGDLGGALPYLVDGLRLDGGNAARSPTHRLRIGSVLSQLPKLTRFWEVGKGIRDIEFSPDGQNLLVCAADDQMRVYDVRTGQLYGKAFGPKETAATATYNRDGSLIAVAEANRVTLWNSRTLEFIGTLPHSTTPTSVNFSPDGKRLVSAWWDGDVVVWNVATQQKELSWKLDKMVRFCGFSHDSKIIVTAGEDNAAHLWDASGNHIRDLRGHSSWVYRAAFSLDDKTLVTGSADRTARAWDIETGSQIRPTLEHNDLVTGVEFSPDGRKILTTCANGEARLWNSDTLEPSLPIHVLRNGWHILHAKFSPDGRCIAAASNDGTVRLWDFAVPNQAYPLGIGLLSPDGNRFLNVINGHVEIRDAAPMGDSSISLELGSHFKTAVFSSGSRFAMLVSEEIEAGGQVISSVRIVDAANGQEKGQRNFAGQFEQAALSDDGSLLAVCAGRVVQICDLALQTTPPRHFSFPRPVRSMIIGPRNKQLAIISGQTVHVVNTASGDEVFAPLEHALRVECASYNPDGTLLATCCADDQLTDGYAQIWDAALGTEKIPALRLHDGVKYVSFSRDNRRIVTASEDHIAAVWEVSTGRQLAQGTKHNWTVNMATFDPAARWIAEASQDATVQIWDSMNGVPVTLPWRFAQSVSRTGFLQDVRHMYAVESNSNVTIWNLPSVDKPLSDLVDLARMLSGGTIALSSESAANSQRSIWNRLRTAYPADFAVTDEDIALWYKTEAEHALAEGRKDAAVFHLENLKVLRPYDPWLALALKRAQTVSPAGH